MKKEETQRVSNELIAKHQTCTHTHTHSGARATPHSDALTSSCEYSLSYCLANGVSISRALRLPLYGLRVNAK